ncbi:unnamed protein product [Vicia faba]|uniref:Alpha-carbonic anhydrase domain-containing protein n=1 Tax=Vicia faba TaxID=3906 RepID=A0AAV0YGC4_VICFA|nr:unnamed protein product [Vicia faba]
MYQRGNKTSEAITLEVGEELSNYIETIEDTKAGRGVGVINPSEIKVGCEKYYRYMGSLTIPPCDEGVIWTINKEIKSVSKTQLELLEEVVPDHAEMNARPVQLLNGREIQLYD